jgi:transposase InsO family protein
MTADVTRLADESKSSVAAVCRVLGLARSTVYAQRSRPISARALDTAQLDVEIKAVHAASKQRYGSPRIQRALRRRGRAVGRKRVANRMRALSLRARRPKRFRRTTQSNPSHIAALNILDRRFHDWHQPNQAWVGDITFVWTREGWVYLAILIDLCTRAIVGWSVSRHCDTELALRCLDNAVAHHRPPPGLLHRSSAPPRSTSASR